MSDNNIPMPANHRDEINEHELALVQIQAEREKRVTRLRELLQNAEAEKQSAVDLLAEAQEKLTDVRKLLENFDDQEPQPATMPMQERHTELYQDQQAVLEYLYKKRGVWMKGSHIMHAVGVRRSPSLVLNPLIDDGRIERKGASRGTLYRMPPLTSV